MTKISKQFRLGKRGKVTFLESKTLGAVDSVSHAFCTRWGGVSQEPFSNFNFSLRVGDREGNVEQNREILSTAFQIPVGGFLTVEQVHGDRIAVINGDVPDSQCYPGCDCIISNRPGLALAVKTADCLPVFLVDSRQGVIGAVHAGWRGTALGIAARAVDTCAKKFSSSPADMLAFIGPSIGPCCYEVGREVFDAFTGSGDYADCFTETEKPGTWMLDLAMANIGQLERAGLPPANITAAGICTACNHEKFFSHRGEGGNTGRQINFLMLQ